MTNRSRHKTRKVKKRHGNTHKFFKRLTKLRYSSPVFAQFRVDYPISSDRVSPRKHEFVGRFHIHW